MEVHEIFSALSISAYLVFFAFAVYAIKKRDSFPMIVALVIAQFLNLLTVLTVH